MKLKRIFRRLSRRLLLRTCFSLPLCTSHYHQIIVGGLSGWELRLAFVSLRSQENLLGMAAG